MDVLRSLHQHHGRPASVDHEALDLPAAAVEAHAALDEVLTRPVEGWPVAGLVAWLLSDGRRIADTREKVEAFCEALVNAGAPVYRMRISVRTLHPEVLARGYTWHRGQTADEVRIRYGIEQTEAFIGSPMQRVYAYGLPLRERVDRLGPDAHEALTEIAAEGATDYLAVPMRFEDDIGGVATLATDAPGGFSDSDLVKLVALIEVLSPILEAEAREDVARSLLDTYLGPRTGKRVLDGQIRRGDGETIDAAMWFSDLRGFTELTESMPGEALLAALNVYFETVAAAVTARGGEILRFIGDAMLIVFPTGASTSASSACRAALDAATDAFDSMETVNHRRRRAGQPPLRFGVGLHVGTVIYGNVGAPDRLDFTVMGPAVNRTARIESLTKTVGEALLMSSEFAAQLDRAVRSMGCHPMKGIVGAQEVFALEHADPG